MGSPLISFISTLTVYKEMIKLTKSEAKLS